MKREVLERYGPLDDSILGISRDTLPFLEWCLDNTKYYCSEKFKLALNYKPFIRKIADKTHKPTRAKMNNQFLLVAQRLIAEGLLPASMFGGRL